MVTKIGRTEYLTATEAAVLCGVARDTFTSYVSRGQAPAPAISGDGVQKLYKRADIVRWNAGRPSRKS